MTTIDNYEKKQEVSFDIADLFGFLWQKKFHLVITIGLLVSVGFMYVTKLPKTYIATATLLLDDKSSGVNLTGLAALTGRTGSKMDTHIEFIRSKQFVRSVVEELDLHLENEFYATIGTQLGQPDIDHAVEVVIEDLTLSHINETDMVKVSFVSKTPEVAANVVNTIGPKFFEFQADKNRERAEFASRWLNSQIDEIQGQLTRSETNLQQFLEENQLVDLGSQIGLLQNEITTLMREQLLTEKIANELQSIVNQVNDNMLDNKVLLGIPKIVNNTVIVELRRRILEQQQVLSEISKRYKYKHYRHITATSQLTALQAELENALTQSVSALKRENKVVVDRQKELASSLAKAREEHTNLGRLEIELTKLRRELDSNQKLYDAFLSRLQETELLKDMEQQGNYAVIDYASIPTRPFKPNVVLSLIVITLLSSFGSVAFWLVLHLLSDTRSKVRQVLRNIDVPVLAELPKPKRKRRKNEIDNIFDDRKQDFAYAEVIRSLRTMLLVNRTDAENRVITVMRVSNKHKNSDLVLHLADSFSRLEKSLLLDSDMRNPVLNKVFQQAVDRAGMTDLLLRKAKLSECIFAHQDSPLQVMTGGQKPTDPLVYLSKTRFAGVVKKLSIIYERLIINLPPINDFSDALVVSKLADAVVLEVDIEHVSVDELLISIQRLQESNLPLKGVVLTNVKGKRKYI